MEAALDRERVHRHLLALNELLEQAGAVSRGIHSKLDRARELAGPVDPAQAALALTIGSFHDAGIPEPLRRPFRLAGARGELVPGLENAGFGEAYALPQLRDGEHCRLAGDRVRQPEPFGEPGCNRHRPVDSRGDDAVDGLCPGETIETLLVLGRDDRTPVGILESRREWIAVAGGHEQAALAGSPQEPELRRPGA